MSLAAATGRIDDEPGGGRYRSVAPGAKEPINTGAFRAELVLCPVLVHSDPSSWVCKSISKLHTFLSGSPFQELAIWSYPRGVLDRTTGICEVVLPAPRDVTHVQIRPAETSFQTSTFRLVVLGICCRVNVFACPVHRRTRHVSAAPVQDQRAHRLPLGPRRVRPPGLPDFRPPSG